MPAPFSRRIVAGAALATLLVPVATRPAGASVTNYCAAPAAARAYVIGLVWADGGIANNVAHFRTGSDARADEIEAAARCAGERVDRNRSSGEWRLRFPGISGDDVNQSGMPPALKVDDTVGYLETKAFLAGVVESEGGRTSGLVVDDIHDGHVDAVKPLLRRMEIGWRQEGNKLYAERPDWVKFSTFPFNVYRRVPGYGITWTC